MILKKIIIFFLYLLISIIGFSKDISVSSITNTSFYKLKNDDKEYSSNTVSANLELFELSTTIKSDKGRIRRGEIFKLNINVKNFSNHDTNAMITTLVLPQGFDYIDNSVKAEGNVILKVEKKENKVLFYFKNQFLKNESLDLHVAIKTNVSATRKENYFSTFSQGKLTHDNIIKSNVNTCKVFLEEESFEEKGTIYGLLFLDKNKNKVYDKGEPTIPSVKIYLENGHFAVTDKDGKFSIFGERPVTHAVRVDMTTAPKDSKLEKLDNRYNDKGDIALIDLKKNELYKVNFAFVNDDEEFLEDIKNRKIISEKLTSEVEEVSEKELTFASTLPGTTVNTSGFFDSRMSNLLSLTQEFEKERQKKLLEEASKKNEKVKEIKPEVNLEKKLKELNNKLDIINLKNGDVVSDVISVEIINSMKNRTKLYVNGEEISEEFIGINGNYEINDLAYYRYDGIKIEKEENEIKVVSISGNQVKEKSIKVYYPSLVNKIIVSYDKEELITNFVEPININIKLENKDKYAIKKPYFISIENSSGVWISPEDVSKDNGLQFIIENGEKTVKLLPTLDKKIHLKIKVGDKEEKYSLNVKSLKTPTTITGVIEGKLSFNDKDLNIFQQGLNNKIENDDYNFSYRTAVFSKGNIMDKYDFIFSYDNTKNDDDTFFQNVKRDNYYLVFGDNSIKGYEAQSKSKLYVSLVGENSTHLYGDYTIDRSKDEFNIGNYSRTLTGYKYNYDNDKLKMEAFISETSDVQKKDEFEARDTSGPYYLSNNSIIDGSEKIEIVVYDKNNLNIEREIIQAPEYTLDYHTGVLYFNTIIPKFDKEGNPIYIRVNYEVDESFDEKYRLYGGHLSYELTDFMKFGGSYFRDKNPKNNYENKSVNLVFEKGKYGKLVIERGGTKKDLEKGSATYVKYTNTKNDKLKSKISFYDSDEGFENPDSLVKSNARLFLVDSTYIIDEKSEIGIDGFNYKDKKDNSITDELVLDYKRNISDNSSVTVGGKYLNIESPDKKETTKTLGIKYDLKPEYIKGLDTHLEFEQDINDDSKKRLSFASEYKYLDMFKFYGKYDFINSIENTNIIGRYNDSYSKYFGIEYKKIMNIKPFIEFREQNNDERDKEIAFGFSSDYKYNDNLSLSAVFERVEGIRGNPNPNSTNFLLSSIYEEGKEKIGINSLDISDSSEVISVLAKNSYAQKLNDDFTFAIKNRYFIKDINKNVVRNRLLLGMAYRDLSDVYSSIFKYEMNYDDQLENPDYTHTSHVFNSINNYQLSQKNIFSFSLGGKYTTDKNDLASENYIRGLVDFNWKYFLNEKVDIGVNTAFSLDNNKSKTYGLGLEVGYKLDEHIWLSLGYNFLGFVDKDFYEDDRYRKGTYLKFRILLDESILDKF